MAAVTTQSRTQAGVTPSPITPSASDTVAAAQFGATGVTCRIITTGTATNFVVTDPGLTPLGNAGTGVTVACPATGVREVFIPTAAINQATGVATLTFSGALTGVTYELYKA